MRETTVGCQIERSRGDVSARGVGTPFLLKLLADRAERRAGYIKVEYPPYDLGGNGVDDIRPGIVANLASLDFLNDAIPIRGIASRRRNVQFTAQPVHAVNDQFFYQTALQG